MTHAPEALTGVALITSRLHVTEEEFAQAISAYAKTEESRENLKFRLADVCHQFKALPQLTWWWLICPERHLKGHIPLELLATYQGTQYVRAFLGRV
jgi:hypothetical protein